MQLCKNRMCGRGLLKWPSRSFILPLPPNLSLLKRPSFPPSTLTPLGYCRLGPLWIAPSLVDILSVATDSPLLLPSHGLSLDLVLLRPSISLYSRPA